eukprot:COSAG06_NODE_2745_length_6354_cov_59.692246_1_plen_49_part_00
MHLPRIGRHRCIWVSRIPAVQCMQKTKQANNNGDLSGDELLSYDTNDL